MKAANPSLCGVPDSAVSRVRVLLSPRRSRELRTARIASQSLPELKNGLSAMDGAPRCGGISFGGGMESIVAAARAEQVRQDVACPTD
jgi:hypothetical protein